MSQAPQQQYTGFDQSGVLNAQIESLKNLLYKRGYSYSASTVSDADSGLKSSTISTEIEVSLQKCEKNLKESLEANKSMAAQLTSLGDKVADQVGKSEKTIINL